MRQQQISDVIHFHLDKWNRQYAVKANHSDVTTRVRQAMERANNNVAKMSVEGIELSQEELAQMKIQIPDAFKEKPVIYEATANFCWGDGELAKQTQFGIEVLM